MPRYFFDIRDDGDVYPDEEGLDLADLRAAKVEAANTLAGIARDAGRFGGEHDVAIEVRTNDGLLFHAVFVLDRSRQ
ncbi:hypothetical protein CK489_30385 [Bradyrhizobium sp. UFLA03-84]|uniref:DUF6894 family protein n=1 Tax=Bradyrhizobium sp. UFLA03-84 TaxID=418599 RepID=UPI000BAE54D8|nr:hypothetical protein [Bradyrhizobium sp. UFLA03-84]PAY05305.1 hypothetical protein CK489_30385 [Bradyrhizobium sp. UFLA03-84]